MTLRDPAGSRRPLLALDPDQLAEAFANEGLERWRAGQVAAWVYRRGVRDFAAMTDLGLPLRARLAAAWSTSSLSLVAEQQAGDGTRKLLLQTCDGAQIESVIIPEARRRTLCVSSQAGCSLDCAFCATGRLGLRRNLRADEIVDQLLHANEQLARGEAITHVVFMGMGEPLLNLHAVLDALRILTHPVGPGLGARRITVSTAGLVPRIAELGRASRVRLAVSLHATTDALRDRLVPLNRRFPIAALLAACREYPLEPGERISFEYTLMRGINDGPDEAHRLVRLLRGIRAKVNLIPMNEHPASELRRPLDRVVEHFAQVLAEAHLFVTVRRSRGSDIHAACGQLAALASPGREQSSSLSRR